MKRKRVLAFRFASAGRAPLARMVANARRKSASSAAVALASLRWSGPASLRAAGIPASTRRPRAGTARCLTASPISVVRAEKCREEQAAHGMLVAGVAVPEKRLVERDLEAGEDLLRRQLLSAGDDEGDG